MPPLKDHTRFFQLSKLGWLFLLTVAIAGPVHAQLLQTRRAERIRPTIDSLLRQLDRSKPDTNRVNMLNALGRNYLDYFIFETRASADSSQASAFAGQADVLSRQLGFERGRGQSLLTTGCVLTWAEKPEAAQQKLRQAIGIFKKVNDIHGLADALYVLAYSHPYDEKNYAPVLAYLQQALRLYRQTGDRQAEAQTLKEIADVHQQQGKLDQSIRELQEVLAIQEKIGDFLHYTYDLMAHVYTVEGNFQRALFCALQSIKDAQATRDLKYIGTFYYRLGFVYYNLGNYDACIQYYKKALERHVMDKKTFLIIDRVRLICEAMLKLKKNAQSLAYALDMLGKYPPADDRSKAKAAFTLSVCYKANQQYAQAETYFAQYLTLAQASVEGRPWDEIMLFEEAGKFYLSYRNYPRARYYFDRALAVSEQHRYLPELSNIHLQLFRLDSAQANFPEAIRHYQQYKLTNDSIFSQEQRKQVAQLQVQYDTEKKEHEITLLLQQSQLQQARIHSSQLQRNVIIGGACMLLLLLGLIYNRYRLKQRSNQELEAKQQKIQEQNQRLEQLLNDKEILIHQKDSLLEEKESLLLQKDSLLEEKEWLLREIHHRVKNNLQIVMSLLNSQAAYLKDDIALSAIQESQHRVHAMALIHQKLYQSDRLATIAMPEYIREVVGYLNDSFNPDELIRFELEVEPIELDVAQAVPLGLIINEAVTNTLKYAFPGNRNGRVKLMLQQVNQVSVLLKVQDNGVGLPDDFNQQGASSLGMSLMRGLSRQLGGQLKLENNAGLILSVVFTNERTLKEFVH